MVRDGTPAIAAGTLVAGVAAYAFQIVGGRALGDEGFAPVASLLSAHSLILAVLLTPVELLTVRRLTLAQGGSPDESDRRSISLTVAVSVMAMVGFVAFTVDRFFSGQAVYLIIGAAVVATHALFAVARGALAGRGRYAAYGLVSGAAAVIRVALAAAWLGLSTTDVALAWTVALPPLVILAWRPFHRPSRRGAGRARAGSGALMAGFVLAGAISQAFVLVGPLVAGALVADAAQAGAVVSVLFVVFSLGRAPLLLAQNLSARLLAGLTKMVARQADDELRSWSRRLGLAGLVGAPAAYLIGASLGPEVITALFGSAFTPDETVAGLAFAGCALAAASVFLDQVLIALGATGKLAAAWTLALVVGGTTLALAGGGPQLRVAAAVLAGELAALVAVMAAAEVAWPESPDSGYDLVKRGLDLVGAAVLIVLTLPVQLAFALAVKLDSPGPLLFPQTRLGKNERPFTMLKFRTMSAGVGDAPLRAHLARVAEEGYVRPDSRAGGPALYIESDRRVTRVGRLLRAASLDELPNLWNVLAGNMSLVGPRPLVPEEVELLGPEARARHRIRPGVTGMAQVEGGSSLTFGERAHWDLRYVERRSLLLDLSILARTPVAALRRSQTPREPGARR